MADRTVWEFLIDALHRRDAACLLMVVASTGSSPGTAGAKMVLSKAGETLGTIGGGRVEFELTRWARQCLDDLATPRLQLFKRSHNEHCEQASGNICGGAQQVVAWLCRQDDLPLLQSLQRHQREQNPVVFSVSECAVGLVGLTPERPRCGFDYRNENEWSYREIVGLRKHAYIVGGGHVSLALSRLLALLDFELTVIDQREGVVTMTGNGFAGVKLVVPYERIDQVIPERNTSYVFVMTHSHETDQLVVERLAGKRYRYFGVMGSRRKIDRIRENLADAVAPGEWDAIRAPLGLPIKSRTPMEIAVAIAAELIQLDNAV